MKLRDIKDLLPFVNYLNKNHVSYRIDHFCDDSLMVTFTLVKYRVEVDFFEDHIEYSIFEGDESVLDDQGRLFALIEDFVR